MENGTLDHGMETGVAPQSAATTDLSDGPEVGVAPRSDPSLSFDWLCDKRRGWQAGEQGILEAIIECLEPTLPDESRWCVEFGAGDNGKLPLTCDRIIRKSGWRSLLIDGDEGNAKRLVKSVPMSAQVVQGIVLLDNGNTIDDYMDRASCPTDPALMVVDIDSLDYYVVTQMKARPYVLCVEHLDTYSSKYNDEAFVPSIEDAGKLFTCPGTIGKFHLVANTKAFDISVPPLGYTLAARTRWNSIYIRNDVVSLVARKPDGKIRLNIGAGRFNDPRYIPVDLKESGGGIDARKLPYEDGSVDEVYSSHMLEHFSFYETDRILAEMVRVLKPEGILRIAVPDMEKIAKNVLELEKAGDTNGIRDLAMIAYGAHSDATDIHHNHFTEKSLREAMNKAGIGMVTKFEPFIPDDCSNHPVSLNLEGVKRWWPRVENPTVTCVMSQPRFTFTGHEIRMIELAKKCDFNIQPCMGAFWERDMNTAIIEAIKNSDPHFLFFSDYDSVFEVEDYQMLLEAIQADPTMAAIGAVQMSRHNDKPLVFENHREYEGDVCRVDFQHFGLTIIRREALEELALTLDGPLFWSIPGRDANGKWDWDQWSRSDGDITFWRNLKLLGMKVCQHNKVCIGHIIQAIKYPKGSGRGVQLQPIENYWKSGKPKDATFNPELYRVKSEATYHTITSTEKKQPWDEAHEVGVRNGQNIRSRIDGGNNGHVAIPKRSE